MKDKLTNEAVEFQPDALEIQQEKLPWWARHTVLLGFLFLVGAIVWACIGQVDVIVQAQGKLVTDEQNIVMKPKDTAVIKAINVKVGEIVKKHQILIQFDTEINQAETERLRREVDSLTAQFNRLHAEFKDQPYTPKDPNSRDAIWQMAIYKQRQQFYQQKLAYYNEGVKQIEASSATNAAQLAKQEERLKAIVRIEKMFSDLRMKDVVSLKDFLEIQLSRMSMESDVDKLRNSLVEMTHQKLSTLAARNSYVEEWRKAISEEMVTVERELMTNQKSYQKMEQLNSYIYLRAPCDAVVHEIAAFSVGSAAREAEALITLVPLTGHLEMEAEVEPRDIGKISVGSEVRVKLNPFPFQKHGTLDGKVRSISEDTFQKQQGEQGATPTYYRARILLSGKLHNTKPKFRLIPGMEAQAEIKTGRRRIIEYVLYPLIKALDETAREP